jgi:hypothetical protein
MNIDRLPTNTSWIGQTGLNIAPAAPAAYSIVPVPSKMAAWLLSTIGSSDPAKKAYPGVLFCPGANGVAIPRPILPNTGNLTMGFDLWIDQATLTAGNSIETDVLIVQNGLKFAMPAQRLTNGQLQVGGWTNVGSPLGALTPYNRYRIAWTYSFSLTAKTCSILFYECNGAFTAIESTFPATPCDWAEGAYMQFQMGSLPAGLPWNIRIGGPPELRWS